MLNYQMDIQYAEFSLNSHQNIKGVKLIGAKTSVRTPTHTIVLLDTSGSMCESNKLTNVKNSLLYLLKYLQPTDILTLITFSTISKIKMNAYTTSENLDMIRHIINTLQVEGGTNLSAGLFNVKEVLELSPTSTAKTGLIILTDGHTNEGVVLHSSLMEIITSLKTIQPNLSITTIGYGDDHNAYLLRDIGLRGGGSYNVVNTQDEVGATFGEILGGLMSCVAQNISIQYPSSWKCMNMYPSSTVDDMTTLYVGDLYSESETTILFNVSTNSPILVKGVNAQTYQIILHSVLWTPLSTSSIASYKVSYIQACVAACLISPLSNIHLHNEFLKLSAYLEDPEIQYHPLVSVLKTEVQHMMNRELNDLERTQHSAFFTTGRGISRRLNLDYDALANQLSNITITSPFSNNVQRELSLCIQADCDPS